MKRMKVRAAEVKQGDQIFLEVSGCSPRLIGEAVTNAAVKRGFAHFRIQYSETYSGARRHWPHTKILVGRTA